MTWRELPLRFALHPAAAFVLEVVGYHLRCVATEVPRDDVEREIDACREAAAGRDLVALDEAHAANPADVGIVASELIDRVVVRRRLRAGEETGLRQMPCARADRHRDVGRRCDLLEPS